MGLETGTYLDDLVATNPPGTDDRSTADDHLRLIKTILKNSFPNVNGAVNPTPTEFNRLVGLTSGIVTIGANETITGNKTLSGTTTISGALTASGNITLSGVIQGASPLVFEGATANDFETTFAITDPTADRTITFPDSTGTVALTSDISSASTTAKGIVELLTDAELAAGTDTTRAATAAAIASLFGTSSQSVNNGYIRIPIKVGGAFDEIIIQWANGTNQAASGNQTVTYPIAFPNAVLFATVTSLLGSAAQNGDFGMISFASTTSATTARNNADVSNGVTPLVIAIGY